MEHNSQTIEAIVAKVLGELAPCTPGKKGIPVGVSNRHIHLGGRDLDTLFGTGYKLTPIKELLPGQYAAKETVTLVGPKGALTGVRVLGPARSKTQVEISRSDGFTLGIHPPVRESGQIEGTPPLFVVGPKGGITLEDGVILALRHIHMHPTDASHFGVEDKAWVKVRAAGERALVFEQVLVRVDPSFELQLHIDLDEANAAGLKNDDEVQLVRD